MAQSHGHERGLHLDKAGARMMTSGVYLMYDSIGSKIKMKAHDGRIKAGDWQIEKTGSLFPAHTTNVSDDETPFMFKSRYLLLEMLY